ncbi:DUF805 domain-containing protein [Sphingomonas asaccharolytica]|uniref:DUF805 domain-containing protein n=1 Tax=Sphingomonas asaccharolytica TaxID=40681 RepID=UPI00082C335A|nr:DUF805 domain-containing protein [Sphingomonas asaccharolytica]
MQWMLMPLKRYADFQGRSTRMEFWMFFLFVMIVMIVLQVLLGIMFASTMSVDPQTGVVTGGGLGIAAVIIWIFYLAILVPSIAVGVRRMHDQDKSGWFILIPIANLVFYCLPGTPGPNRFGPDPLGGTGNLGQTFQ